MFRCSCAKVGVQEALHAHELTLHYGLLYGLYAGVQPGEDELRAILVFAPAAKIDLRAPGESVVSTPVTYRIFLDVSRELLHLDNLRLLFVLRRVIHSNFARVAVAGGEKCHSVGLHRRAVVLENIRTGIVLVVVLNNPCVIPACTQEIGSLVSYSRHSSVTGPGSACALSAQRKAMRIVDFWRSSRRGCTSCAGSSLYPHCPSSDMPA